MSGPQTCVNLIVLYVLDIELTKDWLGEFGLVFDQHQHGNGPIHYGCEHEGLVLEVYPATDKSPVTSCRLGLRVSSIDKAIESAHQINATILVKPKPSPWGIRGVVELPNGIKLELLQTSEP